MAIGSAQGEIVSSHPGSIRDRRSRPKRGNRSRSATDLGWTALGAVVALKGVVHRNFAESAPPSDGPERTTASVYSGSIRGQLVLDLS